MKKNSLNEFKVHVYNNFGQYVPRKEFTTAQSAHEKRFEYLKLPNNITKVK